MVQKELPQAWWFDSHNRAKPSRWLSSTLSELDDKTKQMLNLIEQDADSFAQRAEMYYKKRPVLRDMLGDLYRTHRSLAEVYDLLKHGSGTRHTVFGLSSCTQSRSRYPASMNGGSMSGGGKTTPASSCCSVSTYDSESEVDDPEQEEDDEEEEEQQQVSGTETESSSSKEEQQQLELMRAEIERLKEQNAALQKVAEENAALKAELAGKDEEKREVIRQLASSFHVMREENRALRGRVRESSKTSSPSYSSRAFDLKKVAKDLFSARLFTARCRPTTGPMVAL